MFERLKAAFGGGKIPGEISALFLELRKQHPEAADAVAAYIALTQASETLTSLSSDDTPVALG